MHTDKQIPYLILIRLRGKSKNRVLSMETVHHANSVGKKFTRHKKATLIAIPSCDA